MVDPYESAQNWWLRTPNTGNANNERNVNASGGSNNNNANNAYGAVPDCVNSEIRVGASRKQCITRREGSSSLRKEGK